MPVDPDFVYEAIQHVVPTNPSHSISAFGELDTPDFEETHDKHMHSQLKLSVDYDRRMVSQETQLTFKFPRKYLLSLACLLSGCVALFRALVSIALMSPRLTRVTREAHVQKKAVKPCQSTGRCRNFALFSSTAGPQQFQGLTIPNY